MKRRTFLKGAGGVAVAFGLAGYAAMQKIPVLPKRPMPDSEAALGWIRFEEGGYRLDLPRIEIGQNIATGLKQVACEELGVAWDEVELTMQANDRIDRVRSTVGSESIMHFAIPLAQACATLRDAVASGAADGVPPLTERPLNELRMFGDARRLVGKTPPIVGGDGIVAGEPLYAADIRFDNMVYGRVLRASSTGDFPSCPVRWDEEAARAVPGFVALVTDGIAPLGQAGGIGIVASTPGALDLIAEALDIVWQTDGIAEAPSLETALDIDARLAAGSLANSVSDEGVIGDGAWDIDLRIDIPAAAHAAIEPRAAVARFNADGTLEVWAGNQDIFFVRDYIARHMGLDHEGIAVRAQRVGGAFGGKTICTVEAEAAVLARAVGRPVKVQWTREQEFMQAFHRPPSSHRIRARLSGPRIEAWHHGFVSGHILFTNAAMPEWMQSVTDIVAGDPGVARGSRIPYAVQNQRTEYDLVRLPVLTGPWRGLGAGLNLLAIESAMDECARAAERDPVEFRLDHLEDRRLRRVLERVRQLSGWDRRSRAASPGKRIGWGVACGIYKDMSYAATVTKVEIDRTGAVDVQQVWCVQDSGMIINPDQVKAQCEGNHVWGLGIVLSDDLAYADGHIETRQFFDAPVPRIRQVGPMTIDLIDEDDLPAGAGETAIVSASGALANALREACGKRFLKFPVRRGEMAEG